MVETENHWQPLLSGPRLHLRPLSQSDFEALFAAASDPLIWEQHPDRLRHTRERFEAFFRSGMESKGALAVIDRAAGGIVGSSRYRAHDPARRSVEIGHTFLTRKYWGTGANAELKRLMLDHAFLKVDEVLFVIGKDNARSRKAIERLGAALTTLEGSPGSVVYRITKAAWAAREHCARCGASFSCGRKQGLSRCWCEDLPPVLPPIPGADCLCPACLKEEISKRD